MKTTHRPLRAKLFFNATAGKPGESPQQLADIITEMQNQHFLPEVFMVGPGSRVEAAVRSAIKGGIKLIVVAGGDGTIDSIAGAMIGSPATLGILPTGTRNNLAFNLGIPSGIPDAVALLRDGIRLKIDVGYLRSGRARHWFLEAAALGLLSDLYPSADNIQHGDLGQIGNLLSTFVSSTPSHLYAVLDGNIELDMNAYMVLIANMPYVGPRFRINSDISCSDGLLDMFIFSDMTKLDLISFAMQSTGGEVVDERIKHFRIKQLAIQSDPQMPVLADGVPLNLGPISALVYPRALTVMAAVTMKAKPIASPVMVPETVQNE
jgi:diacylglycerol kinase (ATP)